MDNKQASGTNLTRPGPAQRSSALFVHTKHATVISTGGKGDITVRRTDNQVVRVSPGTRLQTGDTLRIGAHSSVRLRLDSGREVVLSARTLRRSLIVSPPLDNIKASGNREGTVR